MLKKCVEQLLNLYNYIDGIITVNTKGIVEWCLIYRKDIDNLREKEMVGKHILEIYPDLTEETSSFMRVLKNGRPINNEYQVLHTYKGQSIKAVNTTMPVYEGDKLVGAVEVSRYIDDPYEKKMITVSLKETESIKNLYTLDDIVTVSPNMENIKDKIPLVANTDSTVLICGETGTGKELVAQSIHTMSKRRNKRFVSQNCAAIPENLLESILFGTVKGSYTGAENRQGLFEAANGGTLLLDEINSMDMRIQAKILKAIESKKITRVGGIEQIPIDIKLISATNIDPIESIKEGRLRKDLFYRLSVVWLILPPLRERMKDIFCLADYFIKENNKKMNRNMLGIDENVEKIFKKYEWPGNVRELKNIIEGAFNMTQANIIQRNDLPDYIFNAVKRKQEMKANGTSVDFDDPGFSLNNVLADFESSIINEALECSRSLTDAAQKLKISKQVLQYKMEKYGIYK